MEAGEEQDRQRLDQGVALMSDGNFVWEHPPPVSSPRQQF